MTSDYEAFWVSLGFRWYPSTSEPGFFVEGDIGPDRLSWLPTFFPPTEPPVGPFPDRSSSGAKPPQAPWPRKLRRNHRNPLSQPRPRVGRRPSSRCKGIDSSKDVWLSGCRLV